jgi:hypothetical protein
MLYGGYKGPVWVIIWIQTFDFNAYYPYESAVQLAWYKNVCCKKRDKNIYIRFINILLLVL